jgi:hypothetical protein
MAFKHSCSGNTPERLVRAGWHSPSSRPHFRGGGLGILQDATSVQQRRQEPICGRPQRSSDEGLGISASGPPGRTVYFARDRLLYPRQSHNERGEPVFYLSPAKALLREDVSNGVHTTMSVARLQNSRVQYHPFKPKIFKDRIQQAVRLSKYIYYLELKCAKLANPPCSNCSESELAYHGSHIFAV